MVLNDREQECLKCRVPHGCNPGDSRCGISRGMKYGIYPETSHSNPNSGQKTLYQQSCGCKEVPLWKVNEGMYRFQRQLAKYPEPPWYSAKFEFSSNNNDDGD